MNSENIKKITNQAIEQLITAPNECRSKWLMLFLSQLSSPPMKAECLTSAWRSARNGRHTIGLGAAVRLIRFRLRIRHPGSTIFSKQSPQAVFRLTQDFVYPSPGTPESSCYFFC
jgi:hypothetical protein